MRRFLYPLGIVVLTGTAHAQPVEDALLHTASTLLCLTEAASAQERLATCTIALYHTTVTDERRPLLLARAKAAIAVGDVDTATVDVGSVLVHAPTDTTAWVVKGKLAEASADPHAALSAYSTALSYDPRNLEATLGRAMALHLLDEPGYCIADIEQVLARVRDPSTRAAMGQVRGLCRLDAGDFAGAISDLEAAYEAGSSPALLVHLSAAYLGNGEIDRAHQAAEEAVKALKDSVFAHDALFQAMEADDRLEEALKDLDAVAKKSPNSVELANLVAWNAYVSGNVEIAFKHLPLLIDAESAELQDTVGHIAMASGSKQLAMDAFTKALDRGGVRMGERYRERLSAQGILTIDALPVSVIAGIEQCIDTLGKECRLYEAVIELDDEELPLIKEPESGQRGGIPNFFQRR